eukprot:1195751-Prorocentrum_minimum.AAC.3
MERKAAAIAESGFPNTIALGRLAIDKLKVNMTGPYCGSEFGMKNERVFRICQGLVFTAHHTQCLIPMCLRYAEHNASCMDNNIVSICVATHCCPCNWRCARRTASTSV